MALNRVGNIATFRVFATLACFGILRTRVSSQSRLFLRFFSYHRPRRRRFSHTPQLYADTLASTCATVTKSLILLCLQGFLFQVCSFSRFLFSSFERQYKNSTLALSAPLNIVPIVMIWSSQKRWYQGIVIASGSRYVVQSRIQRRGINIYR